MDRKKVVAFLAVLLVIALPAPVAGQSGIVVNGADSVQDTSFTHSQDLEDTTSSIGSRVIAEYSDSTAPYSLIEMPAALQTLFNSVAMMVVVEYADSTTPYDLIEMPTAFQTLVFPIEMVIIEYADSTSGASLAYPLDLMDDNQPPVISQVAANGGTGVVVWITDEFADSEVIYGEQAGQYTQTVSDPLYVKGHEITLTGLTLGTTYYYQVRSADRSGNASESAEYSFTSVTGIDRVDIVGPVTGTVNTAYNFTAVISPATAALPVTYTWSPMPASGQGTSLVAYSWTTTGTKTLAITATNPGGSVTDTHAITINASGVYEVYLPVTLRNR